MMHSSSFLRALPVRVTSLLTLLGCALPAAAHHPLGGRGPESLFEGLLSGFAHPVIGVDHLAFLLAIGLLAIGHGRRYLIPAAFVVTALAGTALHVLRFDLLQVELVIALTVVTAGGLVFADRHYRPAALILLGAIGGLFHGYAYGESIVGAEATPLVAYLVGFSLIQYAIMAAATFFGGRLLARLDYAGGKRLARAVGSAVSVTGLVFVSLAIVAV
jgi:urease accessory protein